MGVAAVLDSVPTPGPMEIRRTEVTPADWDAYVIGHPESTVYHLAGWRGLIGRMFGHRTEYVAATRNGSVIGVLPLVLFDTLLFGRFATSMPFVNYGGVLADTPAAAQALVDTAITLTKSARGSYLELRHASRQFPDMPAQERKVSMVLPLRESVDAQFAAIDRKVRNQVRKAESSGLTTRVGGVELVGAFHRVMSENMRDLGTPLHGRRFFDEIVTTFPDRARIFCVFLKDEPVAASFILIHRDGYEVPWASALRRFNPLCPNMLLYWEMLKFGVEQGLRTFDFGRSTPNEGTYRFKAQWGAQPRQLYWEYWLAPGATVPDRSPTNSRFSGAIAAWQRLPLAVTSALGPRIVRNIP